MTRILIVEDHALVREAMSQTLARLEPGLECVEAACSEQAIAMLEQHDDWDLAVVDLMLPDLNGISLLGIMAKRFPDVPAVVVSAFDDQASVRRAMRAGASGFVSKARSGGSLAERFGLTAAQCRVAELLGQGKTNREIAELLGLSEGTIKVHMSAIFRAMNVRNRAQALVLISRRNSRP